MVKLNKIYTRTGDDGSTGLGDGSRVAKDDARVEAYGAVDEANAAMGLAVVAADAAGQSAIADLLRSIQQDLFDVGADLCVPIDAKQRLRVVQSQIDRLEDAIDQHNEALAPLTSFILPGGSELAARLHHARTESRRAERRVVSLMAVDAERTNPLAAVYLNRLSDLLFVLSRVANDGGKGDVLWIPGANRKS
ncbi:MAG: cob(I)yrinic acid a,c-diamide adenosyltransferase [Phycisphaeraceae bacterium]|nr:cob(I)yrinic acid a,c-diamide adenosyltransferase [Phycisphaeraceae bacterium]MCW5763448.1 cob(I)yrinic acid a,c-diamide adenosyltransferase [Phycisphaeraceae bacterium]